MIHREGFSTLLVTGLVLAAVAAVGFFWLSAPYNLFFYAFSIGFFLFFLQFFRNPRRKAADKPNTVLSPADGKVVVIEKVLEKRFFNKEMMQVSIFMSPTNVHCNRIPFNGKVTHSSYQKGKYLVAFHPKSSELNESTTVVFQHPKGAEVMVRQIAGAVARRIKCYMKEGMEVKAGKEMGFIKFGSRADIYLPLDVEIKVQLGDSCKGAITEIAELKV